MADNVTLNAGSGGDDIAADDVAGVKYQVVKMATGGDGVATPVSGSDPIPASLPLLQKTEDAVAGAGGTGILAIGIRDDPPVARGADGDYMGLLVDAFGRLWVNDEPQGTGGWSVARDNDLDETALIAKAGAGKLGGYSFVNRHATDERFIKIYNSASPTVGTTAPIATIPLKAGRMAHIEFSKGIAMSSGIAFAATTALADNDTGAPAAGDVVGYVLFK